MQFTSLDFLLFAVLFYAVWPCLRRTQTGRWALLTAASFLFYGWSDWRFLIVLVGSGLIDFYAALAIVRWPRMKASCLAASMIGNLGTLAVFKYLSFFTTNANQLLTLIGVETQIPVINLILPVGISFYTFQSMSYTIDVYRGDLKPTGSLLHFFAYLSLFPQLVAGPIVRAADLMPQLLQAPPVTEALRWRGTQLIASGFFKKMVIADTVALAANQAFNIGTQSGGCLFWWVATVAFAVQIYCDFSGYSDIARGLANWMGYEFTINFDHPYIACGLQDFWARWHISLSTWFRDYVYVPLGGSRQGQFRHHLNLWVTMIVSGAWHGANWTFIVWGAMHALLLSLEKITGWPQRLRTVPGGRFAGALATLTLVLISWVFFRADNLDHACAILAGMIDVRTFSWQDLALLNARAVVLTGLFLLSELRHLVAWPHWIYQLGDTRLQPAWTALVLVACVYFRGPGGTFIYFQF